MLPTSWHSTSWFRHLIKQYKHMLTDPRDCCLFVFVRRGGGLCVSVNMCYLRVGVSGGGTGLLIHWQGYPWI